MFQTQGNHPWQREKQTEIMCERRERRRKESQRWRSRSQWKVMFLFSFITWRWWAWRTAGLLALSRVWTIVFFMDININVIVVAATPSQRCENTQTHARGRASSAAASELKLGSQKNCSDTEIITQPTGVFNFRSKIKRSCCERREIINR